MPLAEVCGFRLPSRTSAQEAGAGESLCLAHSYVHSYHGLSPCQPLPPPPPKKKKRTVTELYSWKEVSAISNNKKRRSNFFAYIIPTDTFFVLLSAFLARKYSFSIPMRCTIFAICLVHSSFFLHLDLGLRTMESYSGS